MTRLEYERRRRGWTQTVLAFHARLTQAEISRMERGWLIPTRTIQDRLARALGVDAAGLVEPVVVDQAGQ